MGRLIAFVMVCVLALGGAVQAQNKDETLADIRQELSFLYVSLQRLKRELSTTGGVQSNLGGSTALERIDRIEAELVRLTSKTELLENRINRVVKDGTNRVGDLEFRLVELEGGDVSNLGETTTLGGGDADTAMVEQPASTDTGPELAMGEQGDFDRALAAYDAGDYTSAKDLFAKFTDTYIGGPLSGEAHYYRGEALMALGQTQGAARAFLDSFSGAPAGKRAPEALYKLGVSLGDLGQINEACISLGQVGVRFPGAGVVPQAQSTMQALNCP